MIENLFQLVCLPVIFCSLVSCGTIGGMGKDLQFLGSKMEKVETKRPFATNKQTGHSIDPATLNPAIMNQVDPSYPSYAPQ